ncbi:(2Fe-2S) ferredoxin domain-containing protein [Trichlorobacter ammonificans]|uniref:[NiFe] hydrogenase, diaphorase catalytic subunit n=1 Tax=Trichlorobacter ammonificans TaxID=2916410 RepID=A0ABM9D9K1_9BACT|nr:NADH-ubiquinone oxidoreductase-F iron-sulfur binding region domain-containing protein [Trichlorobacter ammonificans]CAH2031904.1 [NiFe] hydrogenase, diaphorase catalytic subunit [Trichlorobacter ammonificans]
MNRAELIELAELERQRRDTMKLRLLVCCGTPCMAAGSEAVVAALRQRLAESGTPAELAVVGTGCLGPCSRGPLLTVQRPEHPELFYERVTPELAVTILDCHLRASSLPEHNLLPPDFPFFSRQLRVVLAGSGRIDPEDIRQYIGHGGYEALAQVLHEMTPEEVCDGVTVSGLRGRGGGGYPTGLKWHLVRKENGPRTFVVANGDEGDPGAYMDRSLMESDPHRILEGMAIAGYAVGAEQGYLYVRGEYPLAAKRLQTAIRDAERLGVLGSRVLDSSFSFRVDIRIGAGAFVCGEETALLASIMGRRGQPRIRPPYPAQSGLWGCPTLINNVETFGNIPAIFGMGPEAFAAAGLGKSRGTKVFALCGEVVNTGLIEVPMGISLREIVYDIGGGLSGGAAFKAAQTGGPSGGCIPASRLDTPVDYEHLQELGSIMGSGGLIVMGEGSCMVDVARFFMEFCLDESCGKCVPCRAGTIEIYRLLSRICNGSATTVDLENLEKLCRMVKDTSLCGLGAAAPNPVLSTLHWFREEYEAHLRERRCPAGVCTMNELPLHLMAEELLKRVHASQVAGEGF